jgi:hypothetical protein
MLLLFPRPCIWVFLSIRWQAKLDASLWVSDWCWRKWGVYRSNILMFVLTTCQPHTIHICNVSDSQGPQIFLYEGMHKHRVLPQCHLLWRSLMGWRCSSLLVACHTVFHSLWPL